MVFTDYTGFTEESCLEELPHGELQKFTFYTYPGIMRVLRTLNKGNLISGKLPCTRKHGRCAEELLCRFANRTLDKDFGTLSFSVSPPGSERNSPHLH